MTKLLEKAFAKAAQLPEREQEAFAEFVLAELESQTRWAQAFAASQDALASLAREAVAHPDYERLLGQLRRGK